MLKLIIKQKGLILNLPGMPPVRTPAAIRISPKNLNGVMSYLDTHGVKDFKVVSFVDKLKKSRRGRKKEVKGLAVEKMSTMEKIVLQLFTDDDVSMAKK